MTRFAMAVAMTAVLLATPVLANDSSAELAAGGLILTHSDRIEMRSEDLFISREEIVVRYRFINISDKPVRTIVAFPMPDIGGEGFFETDHGLPSDDATNLLDFATTVDGAPVKAQVEQKALVNGLDRTEWLKGHGVPLAAHRPEAGRALDALSAADRQEAIDLGLAWVDEYDVGKGWEKHMTPSWVLKTTFYWTQVFPPGKEVFVEHRYKPSVGGSVSSLLGSSMWGLEGDAADQTRAMTRDYCIDKDLLATVERQRQAPNFSGFQELRIAYILTTGANWARNIGDFRLVVDKGAATNLVSFCGDGVKKISPTRFELRKTDFVPEDDLRILILEPYSAMAE
ncbi:MAG: DUF4424 domain-containing protein [Caulobacter sp.]|nr:DUF4424 domain-containing protein [Caulobacter sp.]